MYLGICNMLCLLSERPSPSSQVSVDQIRSERRLSNPPVIRPFAHETVVVGDPFAGDAIYYCAHTLLLGVTT